LTGPRGLSKIGTMKDGRMSRILVIISPIILIIALSLPLLFLFLLSIALSFDVVRMSRAALAGSASVLSFCQGLLPSRSPPLFA
jgi:hypothetical protein